MLLCVHPRSDFRGTQIQKKKHAGHRGKMPPSQRRSWRRLSSKSDTGKVKVHEIGYHAPYALISRRTTWISLELLAFERLRPLLRVHDPESFHNEALRGVGRAFLSHMYDVTKAHLRVPPEYSRLDNPVLQWISASILRHHAATERSG